MIKSVLFNLTKYLKFSLDRIKMKILNFFLFVCAAKHGYGKESGIRKRKNIYNWLLTLKGLKNLKICNHSAIVFATVNLLGIYEQSEKI